jgi:hypothetical protein
VSDGAIGVGSVVMSGNEAGDEEEMDCRRDEVYVFTSERV